MERMGLAGGVIGGRAEGGDKNGEVQSRHFCSGDTPSGWGSPSGHCLVGSVTSVVGRGGWRLPKNPPHV